MVNWLEKELENNNLLNLDNYKIASYLIESMGGIKIESFKSFTENKLIKNILLAISSSNKYCCKVIDMSEKINQENRYFSDMVLKQNKNSEFKNNVYKMTITKKKDDNSFYLNYLDIAYDYINNNVYIDRCYQINAGKDWTQTGKYYDLSRLLKIELDDNINVKKMNYECLIYDSTIIGRYVFNYLVKNDKENIDNKTYTTVLNENFFNIENYLFFKNLVLFLNNNKIINEELLNLISLQDDLELNEITKKIYNFLPHKDIEKENKNFINKINNK